MGLRPSALSDEVAALQKACWRRWNFNSNKNRAFDIPRGRKGNMVHTGLAGQYFPELDPNFDGPPRAANPAVRARKLVSNERSILARSRSRATSRIHLDGFLVNSFICNYEGIMRISRAGRHAPRLLAFKYWCVAWFSIPHANGFVLIRFDWRAFIRRNPRT